MWVEKKGDRWVWGEFAGKQQRMIEVTVLYGRHSAIYLWVNGLFVGTLYDGRFHFEARRVEWEYLDDPRERVRLKVWT